MKRVLFFILVICLFLPSCQTENRFDHSCSIIKYKREEQNGKLCLTYNEWNKELNCDGTWYPNCTYSQAGNRLGALSPIVISNFSWQEFDVMIPNIDVLEGHINTNRSSRFRFSQENNDGDLIYKNKTGDRIEFIHSSVDGCHICVKYYIDGDVLLAHADVFPY